jgi:phospholipase/carboxylesterase
LPRGAALRNSTGVNFGLAALSVWLLAHETQLEPDWIEIVTGDADPDATLPLVIALHGRGGKAEGMARVMRRLDVPARVIVPRGPVKVKSGDAWFREHVRTDSVELVDAVRKASKRLGRLVRRAVRTRPTCGPVTIVGISQGGMLAIAYAADHPDNVAVAVPIAAWVPRELWPQKRVAVTAFHGTADVHVPIDWAKEMIDVMHARGDRARIVPQEGVGHLTTPELREQARREIAHAVRTQWLRGCSLESATPPSGTAIAEKSRRP